MEPGVVPGDQLNALDETRSVDEDRWSGTILTAVDEPFLP